MDKREFLQATAGLTIGSLLGERIWARFARQPAQRLAQDEVFWAEVRAKYRLTTDYINLENGYYSMLAQPVLEAYLGHLRAVNVEAAHFMRTKLDATRLAARTQLAQLAGCAVEELVVTRNTTESLDLVIGGQHWQRGDEAVMAEQDYGAMLAMFRLQARRHGIENRVVSLPQDPQTDAEIVELYANAITDKTRLLMVCHLVNITGQILPVRKIADMAHARGVAVMVDGAHAFGQLQFAFPDLGCDYYGASLHKWLGCPLGAGILYVQKDRIAGVWPLLADPHEDDDIQHLNHLGTHPVATELAITDAIAFHQSLGTARKQARLRFLQRYWTDQVRGVARVRLFSPSQPERGCAIASVGIDGMEPGDLQQALLDQHRIYTVAIDSAGVHGVRVTPHLYTTTQELNALVAALRALAAG